MNPKQKLAARYREHSYSPFPLVPEEKTPACKWTQFSVDEKGYDDFTPNSNIGVKLGSHSGDLVDIDCDWPESCLIAQRIGLPTLPSFGRASARGGHRLVRSSAKTYKFTLPADCKGIANLPADHELCVIEIRGEGSYTMFPGSVHPNGETIEWEGDEFPEIPNLDPEDLKKRVGLIALLSVVMRFYAKGQRDDVHMALAGALARAGYGAEEIDQICCTFASLARDEEASKRGKGRQTVEALATNKQVTGLPRLTELLGLPESCVKTFSSWLCLDFKYQSGEEVFIEEMNSKHSVIKNYGGKCLVLTRNSDPDTGREYYTPQRFADIRSAYLNRKIAVMVDGKPRFFDGGDFWLKHPKRQEFETAGLYPKGCPSSIFNFWRGLSVVPQQGDWSFIKTHIQEILANGNETHADYIIKWLAYAVQNPEKRAGVALAFIGGRGTGKSLFVKGICKIFGQNANHISNPQHLTGNFNAHLEDTCLLYVDEAYWPGNMSAEGTLKRLITESDLNIERKGIDMITVPNRLKIIFTSNDSWVVPAGEDERRFAVFYVSDERQQDHGYFSKLVSELNGNGLAAMLYDLLAINLDDWAPHRDIPVTEALVQQKIESLGPIAQTIFSFLENGELPFGWRNQSGVDVPTQKLVDYINGARHGRKVTTQALGNFLGSGPSKSRKKKGSLRFKNCGGGGIPRGFFFPTLKDARDAWDRSMFPCEWNELTTWTIISDGKEDVPELPF